MSGFAALASLVAVVTAAWSPPLPQERAAATAGAQQAAPELEVTLYRSWQPPNVTVVEGLFRVDPALGQAGGECRYVVGLEVADSAGNVLTRDEWRNECPRGADGAPAAALETFQFAVLPSRYEVRLAVRPELDSARVVRASVALQSLAERARISDLVLAREVGWVDSASDRRWTFEHGKIGILTASEIVVQAEEPHLSYYVEVYTDSTLPLTGRLVGVVKREAGDEVARVGLRELREVRQSQPVAGRMSVAGLPPGEYVLETRLELGDTVLVREHPFVMDAPLLAGGEAAADYFARLGNQELRDLFDPLVVWLRSDMDRGRYETLSPDGKRAFLRQYFAGAEPSGDPDSEAPLDMYLARVRHVNAAYRERAGRGEREGWRTDRGRIYLLRGEPTNRVARPRPQVGPPYEIWFYAIRSGYVYLFVDETGFGEQRLWFSNDPAENSLPGWEQRIGVSAMEDLAQFGIRLRTP